MNSIEHAPKVSILMPVFNAAEFLHFSIESVLKQIYVNWELVCVNDGSSDSSLDILVDYSKRDNRIKVLSQENKGAAAARCLGAKNCTGEVITLLDADDCLSQNYISANIQYTKLYNVDIVVPVLVQDSFTKAPWDFNVKFNLKPGDTLSGLDAFKLSIPWRIHGLNLYSSDLFKACCCDDVIHVNKFNSDEIVTRLLFLNSRKVFISGQGMYFYRGNVNSTTNRITKLHSFKLESNEILFEMAKKWLDDKEYCMILSKYFFISKIKLICKLYYNKNLLSNEDFNEIKLELRKERSWENMKFGIMRKVIMLILNNMSDYSLRQLAYVYYNRKSWRRHP